MLRKTAVLMVILLLSLSFTGCVDNNVKNKHDVDLTDLKLKVDDLKQGFQKIEESEKHITEPYIVQKGKMFEGMKVYEKYEVLFLKNLSTPYVFLELQIARLSSSEKSEEFINTLKSRSSIPGIENEWNFTEINIETIGDDSVLKQNKTVIDGNNVTIYILAFRMNDIVYIIASGSIKKSDILMYGKIAEQRINDL